MSLYVSTADITHAGGGGGVVATYDHPLKEALYNMEMQLVHMMEDISALKDEVAELTATLDYAAEVHPQVAATITGLRAKGRVLGKEENLDG